MRGAGGDGEPYAVPVAADPLGAPVVAAEREPVGAVQIGVDDLDDDPAVLELADLAERPFEDRFDLAGRAAALVQEARDHVSFGARWISPRT